MPARSLMFQGTGSDVGKSLIVAGLCRLFARRGLRVAPFKAQNMSNNAAVTRDGGEIGRAQWLQAFSAGIEPSVHMNPVLLKPQSGCSSQIIVRGKATTAMNAHEYHAYRSALLPEILESYRHLSANADLVLIEGAGSPAEINLRENDIANMGFACAANCPVVLIGDIDRGGVIASLVGTHTVLPDSDRKTIQGFLINKFRGDPTLFTQGAQAIIERTGWKNLGLIPHYPPLRQLPQEDSLALQSHNTAKHNNNALKVVVLACPHIANFDDLDPLQNDPAVHLIWCRAGEVIPAEADLVILPGSKSTIEDLAFLRTQGWDIDLRAHWRRGGHIIGLCGGFQMLGNSLSDPMGVEGAAAHVEGLHFLEMETVFTAQKKVTPWQGHYRTASDAEKSIPLTGYEIHCGTSSGPACARPVFYAADQQEGARSDDGRVWGSYIHGIFGNDVFRSHIITQLGAKSSPYIYATHMQDILDGWADVLEANISIETLLSLAMPVSG